MGRVNDDTQDIANQISNQDKNVIDDKEKVMKALRYDISLYPFISNRLKEDDEIAYLVININALLLENLPNRLKKDKKLVSFAVSKNTEAFRYADKSLHEDRSFIMGLDFTVDFVRAYHQLDKPPYLFDIDIAICRKIIASRYILNNETPPDCYSVYECYIVSRNSKFFDKKMTFEQFITSIVEYEDANSNSGKASLRILKSLFYIQKKRYHPISMYTINYIERVVNFKKSNPFVKITKGTDQSRVVSDSRVIDRIGTMNFNFK